MARINDLLRRARELDPQLGADLTTEFKALTKRRNFGLVFENHQPEIVELPGQQIKRGDKVRILPPRGETRGTDHRIWRVEKIQNATDGRLASLIEHNQDEPELGTANIDDLVVVAEFRDPIFPGLRETGRIERGSDKPYHTVINGENYHALEMLSYTHRHKIDVIYIDPPYNTGAKDWKYNNDYVEGDDDYRHSKWLAMMQRRLLVARELLNPVDSVLIVTIDEKEYLRLGLLLEQTFPEAHTQMITIVINHNGVARNREMSRVEEYAYFVYFGTAQPVALEDPMFEPIDENSDAESSINGNRSVRWEWLLRGGAGSARKDSPGCFYPVYIDPHTFRIAKIGDAIDINTPASTIPDIEGLVTVLPIGKTHGDEKRWRMTPESLRVLVDGGFAKVGAYNKKADRWSILYLGQAQRSRIASGELEIVGRDPNGALQVEGSATQKVRRVPKTIWNRRSHNAGEYGSRIIGTLLPDRRFPYPKSLYAVEDTLRTVVAEKQEAVILDYFSGSGTTAHAVMRLNNQDGGSRQCISITNNEVSADEQRGLRNRGLRPGDPKWEEWGICDYITKPRLTSAITGTTPEGESIKGEYKFIDEFPMANGFEENAAFFTLTYESPLTVKYHRAFEKIAPMLWLRAGAQGPIIDALHDKGWGVSTSYGVLENIDNGDAFVEAVHNEPSIGTAFIITDDDAAFQMVIRDLPQHVTTVQLYESYLQNFAINMGRSL